MKKTAKRKSAKLSSAALSSAALRAVKRAPSKKRPVKAPALKRQSDWEIVQLPFNIGSGRTLYAGLEKDSRLRLRVFRMRGPVTSSLVGRAWFGLGTDGPPKHVHGGASAYVLDEAMGAVAWMNDFPALAAKLEFAYVMPTPLEVDLHLTAEIAEVKDRRLEITARLSLPTGELCVLARGEFARMSKNYMRLFPLEKRALSRLLENKNLKWVGLNAG